MSRLTFGILISGVTAAFGAARLAATRLPDEETDGHGWVDAAGGCRWLARPVARDAALADVVLDLPAPRRVRARAAA